MEDSTMIIFGIGILVFSIFFLLAKNKHASLLEEDSGKKDLNSNLPVEKQMVVVLSKIDAENPNGVFFGFPHIIFETENSERIKIAIVDKSKYDDILVGDRGILSTKGNAFISFERL